MWPTADHLALTAVAVASGLAVIVAVFRLLDPWLSGPTPTTDNSSRDSEWQQITERLADVADAMASIHANHRTETTP